MEKNFYICPSCGEITNDEEISTCISYGGMGLCGCEYVKMVWNSKEKYFEPDYWKYYPEWIEISRKVANMLLNEKNHVLRLEMFRTIPEEDYAYVRRNGE